ncbi:MAG: hypothetical protein AB199_04335 [Parcubacteria bacterium C7867-004]|nr:MAG: hypothetical protein AB199_04335 [Parcubacteria bacterium C7867-004]
MRSPARFLSVFAVVTLLLGAVIAPTLLLAQEAPETAERRAKLQAELDALEKDIAANQAEADKLNAAGQTLSRDVQLLDNQIHKAKLQVQATQLGIQQLSGNIVTHTKTIGALDSKLVSEKESLAQILRNTDRIDDYSLVEVALSAEDVSSFFSDLDTYSSVKQALGFSFNEIRDTRSEAEKARDQLEEERKSQEDLKQAQELAKGKVQTQQDEKKKILTVTKGQESAYKILIQSKQKTASQIRAELFALAGGNGEITLPVAIALAKQAGAATGVNPALILGILKQETNLGKNVGQCLLTNSPAKGDGKGKNTGTPFAGVMKPTRDVDPFMAITASLGIDPYAQVVSCPPSYGYGGAMGPAQFIPSTWVLYKDRIASLAGHPGTPANPWNNLDAFTATALLMADNGATAKTPAAERTAALRYFAGWGNASNPAYAFYGDGVMGFAAQFESDINTLGGS